MKHKDTKDTKSCSRAKTLKRLTLIVRINARSPRGCEMPAEAGIITRGSSQKPKEKARRFIPQRNLFRFLTISLVMCRSLRTCLATTPRLVPRPISAMPSTWTLRLASLCPLCLCVSIFSRDFNTKKLKTLHLSLKRNHS